MQVNFLFIFQFRLIPAFTLRFKTIIKNAFVVQTAEPHHVPAPCRVWYGRVGQHPHRCCLVLYKLSHFIQTKETLLGSNKGSAKVWAELVSVCLSNLSRQGEQQGPVWRGKHSSSLLALVWGLYRCFPFMFFETIVWRKSISIYLSIHLSIYPSIYLSVMKEDLI